MRHHCLSRAAIQLLWGKTVIVGTMLRQRMDKIEIKRDCAQRNEPETDQAGRRNVRLEERKHQWAVQREGKP